MTRVHAFKPARLSRRRFLRGSGAALLSLPVLEAMSPGLGRNAAAADGSSESPKRFVAMCASLGFHGPLLFPNASGRDYELTPYLQKLKDHRDDLTLFSGLSHAEQQGNNGHASELTWLTSAKRPGLSGFKNTISLDQLAGGGYKHGAFVAHDAKNNTPLANLFVALAQRMGIEIDRFGSSTAAGVDGLT